MAAARKCRRLIAKSTSGEMRGRMDYRKFYAKPLQLGDVMTGEMAGLESANRISPRALF